MTNDAGLQQLAWESNFFEKNIYSLDVGQIPHQGVFDPLYDGALIQVKVSATQLHLVDKLHDLGFQWVESELFFSKQIDQNNPLEERLLHAGFDDEDAVAEIASQALVHSRFREPWFEKGAAGRFYGQWAKNAIHGQYDDVCLKIQSEMSNELMGFVTAKINHSSKAARIGLIAVANAFHNKKCGSTLLRQIESWAKTKGLATIDVATQGSNLRAAQFYLKNAFQMTAIQYWFYRCQPERK